MATHHFTASLIWSANEVEHSRYKKNHKVQIDNKTDIEVSAAKTFKGDATRHNPEDLLLSSLMSCHMMSYMYCCEKYNVKILKYEDHGEAILEVNSDGSGRISRVILNPKVQIYHPEQYDLALQLHEEAHRLCFIANSCRFEIVIKSEIISL